MAQDLGLGAIIGYALGTAQILLLGWVGNRAAHRRYLRQLRSDLRRLASYRAKFNWLFDVVPDSDNTPNPPSISGAFISLCQKTDFWLTDEHKDDNSLEALLSLPDGCGLLLRHSDRVHDLLDEARTIADAKQKHDLYERAVGHAQEYDRLLNNLMTSVDSAIADVERRLREAGTWRQLLRTLRPLPRPPAHPGSLSLGS